MQMRDIHTGYSSICGFSIKSDIGAAPTLVNASGATNFIFEVKGLSEEQIESINSINTRKKIIDRMQRIFAESESVDFVKVSSDTFGNNLMMIDTLFPKILANALVYHYRDETKNCSDVLARMEEDNPMGFPSKDFYRFKFKKFLCSIALGMLPTEPWDGKDEANGGYIIVTDSGDVLAYHLYNRNCFEEYLLNQTIFERASTSRHGFATLYNEGGKTYVKLNLQIRFK